MGQYRELHLSSRASGRTSGTRSHPRFIFQDPIYADKYCLKNLQLPLTWLNVTASEKITFSSVDSDGDLVNIWPIDVPPNCYSAADFADLLQTELNLANNSINNTLNVSFVNTKVSVYDACGRLYLQFLNLKGGATYAYFINFSADNSDVAKMMGYAYQRADRLAQNSPPNYGNWRIIDPPSPVDYQTPFPFKYTDTNYILMRSSMAKGGSFTPNVVAQKGSSGSGDVLAKIPMNFTQFPFNSYLSYGTEGPPLIETMFNYNGTEIDTMDIYFTREFDDTPIDFNGLYFSCTIGVWTSRTA